MELGRNLLYIDISTDIERKILAGLFKEGEKLPSERQLTTEYRVSRNVIRQAITILRQKGFLDVKPGKGAYVTRLKENIVGDSFQRLIQKYDASLEDILDVREDLEVSIIRRAVRMAGPEHINKLNQIVTHLESRKEFVLEFIEGDLNFHLALAESTRNQIYSVLVRSFFEMTEKSSFTLTSYTNNFIDVVNTAQSQHWRMIQAIIDRNEEQAVDLMYKHMNLFREEINVVKNQVLSRPTVNPSGITRSAGIP
ncbi:FadR/GntR family transcriptional regulator [Ammoniphilus resinae]|uniref:DNA-binding FadR family transcriptional regulator n=1 Tax=Ammoniphilus resinae TaxID=861532 RepID=A0ABS4GMB0_9BACL|nr:FadR/GntR family transcriptional regulator [Ammoniphilus resinae]MBP1931412.1 DNA-binding FadR family transcriptional regulator [Ammoniphilus resinae]